MPVSGRITSVQVSGDGKQWLTLPPAPEIARFAYFYVYPYGDIIVEGRANVKCVLTLTDPSGVPTEIEPMLGTVETGSYYFPYSLQTMDDAPLGVWQGKIELYGAPEGSELALLDTWEGELFNLVAVGNPAAEIVRAEFSVDQANWLTVPTAVQPGSPLAFRVGMRLWLPLRTKIQAELSLIDPYGIEVKKEIAEAEFPPAYSEAWATFSIDEMPEKPGDWIGRAIIKALHEGEWLEIARWDGYVARMGAAQAPPANGIMGAVTGLAVVGMMMPMIMKEVGK
ncbi:MAG: hypothetical protein V1724_06135 [Chloroflexota bacterium]